MISANLAAVLGRINEICRKIGRDPQEVILVGVTKYAQAAKINEAIKAGLSHIGENKVQEAKRKFPALIAPKRKLTRHMIGHLQGNKVREALEYFDMIQSVDSLKLVDEIEKRAAAVSKQINILIQVNTSGEKQKFGVEPKELFALLDKAQASKHISVEGLMAIAPLTKDKEVIRQCFRDLKNLREQAQEKYAGVKNIQMKYLSMGMSDDFEIALEEGANMVRIGSAIFKG